MESDYIFGQWQDASRDWVCLAEPLLVYLPFLVNVMVSRRVLIMPQVRPVTAQTMNYAGPIMGFVCGISWIWYKLYWVSPFLLVLNFLSIESCLT